MMEEEEEEEEPFEGFLCEKPHRTQVVAAIIFGVEEKDDTVQRESCFIDLKQPQ